TEANIEQILPSPSIYQRKHRKTQKHKRAKKVNELPQTSVPLDLGADEAVHKEGSNSVERAITTNASLVAAHDRNGYRWQSQAPRNHGGAPTQTRFERVLKQSNEPPFLEGHTSGSGEGRMAHTFELMDIVPPTPYDSPLPGGYTPGSDEGRLKLEELMAMCTKLSKHVLNLEKEKDAQAVEILKLKKRVNKLKRHRKSGVSHLRRRIYKQIESSDDDFDFDGLDDDMENVEGETVYVVTSGVSTAGALVSTARPTVSTVGPFTSFAGTSTSILEDEMVTMADTLIAIRQTRTRPSYLPRPSLAEIINTEQEQRRLTTPPPSQPSDTRDKGKGIMVELDPPVKIKMSDQERAAQEEASIAALYEEYDPIQASIDADALFAARLQQEERDQFTIKERA
ncbi:hypothetical protein Tco_0762132, partial [Tanacetum coccineum]